MVWLQNFCDENGFEVNAKELPPKVELISFLLHKIFEIWNKMAVHSPTEKAFLYGQA